MQLEEEIQNVSRRPTGIRYSHAEDTFVQQYDRNPNYVQKYHPQGDYRGMKSAYAGGANNAPSSGQTFEESRRRNECHKCRAPWRPGHRCKSGSIRHQVCQRFSNGDSAVHTISELVSILEEELDQDHAGLTDVSDTQNQECEKSGSHIHLREDLDKTYLFDSLTSDGAPDGTNLVERADHEWYTHHLSSSMSSGHAQLQGSLAGHGFEQGDEVISLIFVAQRDGQLPILQAIRDATKLYLMLTLLTFM